MKKVLFALLNWGLSILLLLSLSGGHSSFWNISIGFALLCLGTFQGAGLICFLLAQYAQSPGGKEELIAYLRSEIAYEKAKAAYDLQHNFYQGSPFNPTLLETETETPEHSWSASCPECGQETDSLVRLQV